MSARSGLRALGWSVAIVAAALFVLVPLAGLFILWLLEQGGG